MTPAINSSSLIARMRKITSRSKLFSTRNLYVSEFYVNRPRIKHKTGFKLVILFSFAICAFAATDCEILNSGIPAISATDCCTGTAGISCFEGRVIAMYVFYYLPSSSKLSGVVGKLPQELGNLTELVSIDIRRSDLEAGSVPDSIATCTKLEVLILFRCKLPSGLPIGLRKLKLIGIPILKQKNTFH
jgi:hypothetical protein